MTPSGRQSFPHIPGFKTPPQADQERKDKKTFGTRMLFVLVAGCVLGCVLSGVLGVFTVPGVLAICGMCCGALTMCLIKEVR